MARKTKLQELYNIDGKEAVCRLCGWRGKQNAYARYVHEQTDQHKTGAASYVKGKAVTADPKYDSKEAAIDRAETVVASRSFKIYKPVCTWAMTGKVQWMHGRLKVTRLGMKADTHRKNYSAMADGVYVGSYLTLEDAQGAAENAWRQDPRAWQEHNNKEFQAAFKRSGQRG